jgi:hypothetical protein
MKRKCSDAPGNNSAPHNLISPLVMSPHQSQNPPAAPPRHKSLRSVHYDPPAQSSVLPPSHTPSATTAPAAPRGTAPQNHSQTSSPYPRCPHQSQPQQQPGPSLPTPATTVSTPESLPSKAHTTSPKSSPAQPARDAPTSSMSPHQAAPSPTPAPPVAHRQARCHPTAASQSATQPRPPRTRAQQWHTEPIVAALPASRLSSEPDYPFSSVHAPCTVWGAHDPK